jgi:tripartite-type tricarboxylate transporter receptor subunit TctC
VVLVASAAISAGAQDAYPSRPVVIITNAGLGSSPDVLIRILAEELGHIWGQRVVVENNSTGGGLAAAQRATEASADGYTLLLASASAFTVLPVRHENAPTKVGTDLKPIAFLGELPMAFAVSPKLGVKTIKELVDLSQREPERIFYAANQAGSLPHMSGEHLKSRTGASLTFVPYRGAADALVGVMSGQMSMMIENYVTLQGAIQSGDLVLLAFASKQRLANFPDVPTVAETVPDFLAVGWSALMAPAGVPDALVERINTDVRRIFNIPEVRKRMDNLGNYPVDMSTAALATFIRQEQEQWRPIVRKILAAPRGSQIPSGK